jgi:hypothetical protein
LLIFFSHTSHFTATSYKAIICHKKYFLNTFRFICSWQDSLTVQPVSLAHRHNTQLGFIIIRGLEGPTGSGKTGKSYILFFLVVSNVPVSPVPSDALAAAALAPEQQLCPPVARCQAAEHTFAHHLKKRCFSLPSCCVCSYVAASSHAPCNRRAHDVGAPRPHSVAGANAPLGKSAP